MLKEKAQKSTLRTIHIHHNRTYHSECANLLIVHNGNAQLSGIHGSLPLQAHQMYLLQSHCDFHFDQPDHLLITLISWQELEIHIKKDHDLYPLKDQPSLFKQSLQFFIDETQEKPYHDEIQSVISELVLFLLLRDTSDCYTIQEQKKPSKEVAEIHAFLSEHYAQQISLKQLADQIHMNKYSMVHLYRNHTGHTINEELIQIRCHHANELLCSGKHSIKEIAQLCGFSSVSYFIQVFQKHYHHTPLQYRKAYLRSQKKKTEISSVC